MAEPGPQHMSRSLRLEVSVNGRVLATGGVGEMGALTAMVTWLQRNPETDLPSEGEDSTSDRASWLAEEMDLDLGGIEWPSSTLRSWIDFRPLQVGDDVRIRVLEPGPIDAGEVKPRPQEPPRT